MKFNYEDVLQDIPVIEYQERVKKAREMMARQGYEGLLVWSDAARMSNVRWLANYRAFDGVFPYPAMVFLPLEGEPILMAEGSLVSYAKDETWFSDVRGIRQELPNVLKDFQRKHPNSKIGMSGSKYLALEFYEQIQDSLNVGTHLEKTNIIEYLKSIKSENEIRNMKVAGRLADIGIETIHDLLKTENLTEREVARQAYAAMFANGADTVSFDIMVQSGPNSSDYFLARPRDRKIQKGDTVLIDIGCRFNGYSSDMARGVAYGNVSKEKERMLEVCLEAWREGMSKLRPGMTGAEADIAANEVLKAAGYDHASGEGRGCAHSTGMDPEEEIPVIGPGSEDVLVENQTIAFEITLLQPGVGGTRVEDTVVIRKDGAESLTNFPHRCFWYQD
ncbi:Xaa-Pro peptidase family protein [Neobacillus sp. YX16]|uniref:M24 family metallopeptidase n=1 Tax=Neobacillus sp. YX16 TaxID=3047874 RepID=UPI0024C2844F|nr:Xaa-Pro peptidase family protein [Neobacillus sp. YX16]WHZ02834.1 Xaa-Pro peptidase family protein [Neobacillus sp. YX16]